MAVFPKTPDFLVNPRDRAALLKDLRQQDDELRLKQLGKDLRRDSIPRAAADAGAGIAMFGGINTLTQGLAAMPHIQKAHREEQALAHMLQGLGSDPKNARALREYLQGMPRHAHGVDDLASSIPLYGRVVHPDTGQTLRDSSLLQFRSKLRKDGHSEAAIDSLINKLQKRGMSPRVGPTGQDAEVLLADASDQFFRAGKKYRSSAKRVFNHTAGVARAQAPATMMLALPAALLAGVGAHRRRKAALSIQEKHASAPYGYEMSRRERKAHAKREKRERSLHSTLEQLQKDKAVFGEFVAPGLPKGRFSIIRKLLR